MTTGTRVDSNTDISEAVRRLILERIDTVPQLEAILLLRENPEHEWSVTEAGQRLYVSPTVAAHTLAVLAERGFFERVADNYRYSPEDTDLESVVAELASTYAMQVVAVTHLIHAKPSSSVRQFAEAFRLRREK